MTGEYHIEVQIYSGLRKPARRAVKLKIPVLEVEVPPITDAVQPTLRTRFESLIETCEELRRRCCVLE